MKKIIYSLIILISLISGAQSIKAQGYKFTDNLYWGGSFGISIGTYTYIQIAPILNYEISDEFTAGVGLEYTYFADHRAKITYAGSIWTPRVFIRYFFLDDFFAHLEFQQSYYKDAYTVQGMGNNWLTLHHYYAGAGYRSWVGDNSYMYAMLLFDLERRDINFGSNPIIQIGFASGF